MDGVTRLATVRVVLSPTQMDRAILVGGRRMVNVIQNGRSCASTVARNDMYGLHIEAAASELVVALVTGEPWHDDLEPHGHAPDVGDHWHVRHTVRPDGHLILQRGEPPAGRFVLVTGQGGAYDVRGWISGRDAQFGRYWRTDVPRAAFFVPQAALIPVPAVEPFTSMSYLPETA